MAKTSSISTATAKNSSSARMPATRLTYWSPRTGSGPWLFLVLGNSPGEIVCDYGVKSGDKEAVKAFNEAVDKVTNAHYLAWEGRKQPTTTVAERYPKVTAAS